MKIFLDIFNFSQLNVVHMVLQVTHINVLVYPINSLIYGHLNSTRLTPGQGNAAKYPAAKRNEHGHAQKTSTGQSAEDSADHLAN